MILADALSYAKTLYPELVIDVATLTGAVVVALGEFVAGVMSNMSNGEANSVTDMVAAGARSGDRVHPLPMFEEYADLLKLMGAIREKLLRQAHKPEAHKHLFNQLIDGGLLEMIRDGRKEDIHRLLVNTLGEEFGYDALVDHKS